MALTVGMCVACQKSYPYAPVEYSPRMIAALIFDVAVVITLIVVGILAIIGNVTTAHNSLQVLGTGGGGAMIGIALLIILSDVISHKTFTGFEPASPIHTHYTHTRIFGNQYEEGIAKLARELQN
jgi:hypothetical protein